MVSKKDKPENWDKVLPMALFACRDTPHVSTGLTPFEILFGWDVRGPLSLLRESWTSTRKLPKNVLEYLQQLRKTLDLTTSVAVKTDSKAKADSKKSYDKNAREDPIKEGEEVLILHPDGPSGWKGCWAGPYLVEEVLSPVTYRIATPGKCDAVLHRNHIKRYIRSYHVNTVVLADRKLDNQGQLELPRLPGLEEEQTTPEREKPSLTDSQRSQLQEVQTEFKRVIQCARDDQSDHHGHRYWKCWTYLAISIPDSNQVEEKT